MIIIQFIATQHPSETQQIIAKMLNQKSNSIDVLVRRIGGGFGGKETNFMTSAICALLSHKTKKQLSSDWIEMTTSLLLEKDMIFILIMKWDSMMQVVLMV